MMIEDIGLKSVNELVDIGSFFIPSYQRGYRWEESQVLNLLDDLEEFMQGNYGKDGVFYCLQPLVVRKRDKGYEVIDGQQRLTTIAIIIAYLKEDAYTIQYKTRPDSAAFIQNIAQQAFEESDTRNIDYHFFKEAYKTVKKWFEEDRDNKRTFRNKFSILLGEQVKVIWYEVDEQVEVREVFSRLNSGKIPLTNAELIKAFIILHTSEIERPSLSTQWDMIERKLQKDRFWYFLGKKKDYTNHIEFLFDIVADHVSSNHPDPYYTFYKLQSENTQDIWNRIISDFALFEEWYEDRECYHLLGYLTQQRSITEYIKLYRSDDVRNKTHFKQVLKQLIAKEIGGIALRELEYGRDNQQIQKVLLFFNILTVHNQKNIDAYFPFEHYIENKWSLEHIHAQSTEGLRTKEQWETWIQGTIDLLSELGEYKELVEELSQVSIDKLTEELFNQLFNKVLSETGSTFLNESNGLDNLVLLDQNTNSSLSNHFYPVKFKRLISHDKTGAYIPFATRNAFMKYYSDKVDQFQLWSPEDGECYVNAIEQAFASFIKQAKGEVSI
ncbi:DUF262 domain-containing protein [Metabacillus fastidiosus]|uniref:DUF262 domain-containing protein n=1 Tax=Metabacillus fastidiosus TaxID=1458 RepID=UPI002E1D2C65|nr:DUF262 domain-containing protein [Metabacillus fastidiosus]